MNSLCRKVRLIVLASLAALGSFAVNCACAVEPGGPIAEALTFEADVRPLLKAHCFQCHGEGNKTEGGLDLRLRRLLVQGGESGPAIVPGDPRQSYLIKRLRSGEMPPAKDAKRLSPEQIAMIERWISVTAPTARPEPENLPAGAFITAEERRFWSFQPIQKPRVPRPKDPGLVRIPLDAFLLDRLEQVGASFAPEADRRTLLRRTHFDLLGLPPTPEEVERFLEDEAPDAYNRLLDRLLASPHYGERWGRHWLDVAGYADSDGYTPADPVREHIFRYRDYVIRSHNADKPFDEFIREQLAGDEMVPPPHANLTPEQAEKLVATGFLVMAPNPLASNSGADPRLSHDLWISEEIKIVSSSLLGLTVGCAQCHDHRFDPITHEDYYRFRAIFEPAFDLNRWRVPRQQLLSLYTDADRERAKQVELEAKVIDERKRQAEQEAYQRVLERELEKVPEEDRDQVRAAHVALPPQRTPEQRKLLVKYPRLNFTVSNLPVYDRAAAAEVKKIGDEAARVRASAATEGFIHGMVEAPGRAPRTFLLARGDFLQPKQALPPDELSVLKSGDEPAIRLNDPALPTTGRRLAYARRLTDGTHPLVARVVVNRVWMHHFGRGLCSNPADFGSLGERPSHPELLDWLAQEFVSGGWSLKQLHRLIMTSTAYRQSGRRSEKLERVDPDNQLLGGFPLRRLEAEVVRDSILAVSGKLNTRQFGPPVPVMRDPIGEIVIGVETTNAGIPGPPVPMKGEEFRRSIYVQVRRSRPLTMLQAFDAPTMEPNCAARNSSTVAPQSLMLMNGSFMVEQSRAFVDRLFADISESDIDAKIARAWRLALMRPPSELERSETTAFVQAQTEHFRTHAAPPAVKRSANRRADLTMNGQMADRVGPRDIAPSEPEYEALALLCQMLLSSSEFLYVD